MQEFENKMSKNKPMSNEEFMKDFLDFKNQFEIEMGLDQISAISTDIQSTAKKSTAVKPKKLLKEVKEIEKPVVKPEKKEANNSEAAPGPTSYEIKYNAVERKGAQGYSFGKLKEVKKQKKEDWFLYYPNIDAVRPNFHPSKAVMKPLVHKPKAFSPERSQITSTLSEAETRVSSAEKVTTRKKQGISIAPQQFSKLTSEELDKLLWHQLLRDPTKYLEGRFLAKKNLQNDIKFTVVEKRAPGPKFINKKTVPRNQLEKELEERYRPNVHTYSPDDRRVKQRLPLYTIPKGRKGERTPSPDRRKALYVTEKLTKKNTPKIGILPEHNVTEKQLLQEFEKGHLGPASYQPVHDLVEARPDKGVLKMHKPEKSLERDPQEKVLDIHPNFDYDKPNKGTHIYHEPAQVGPQHTPDKVRNPGKWRFYDFDMNAIREEIAKEITFARNLTPQEFLQKEEFFHLLQEHNRRLEKQPGVGQYEPNDLYKPQEVDFSKARDRFPNELKLEMERDMDKDGDVLILSPKRPERHMQDIKFERQTGREVKEEVYDEMINGERLILEPNIDAIRKKQTYLVTPFDKQKGRDDQEKYEIYDKDDYIYAGLEEEKIDNNPNKKSVVAYSFGMPKQDFKKLNPDIAELLEPPELIIEAELPKKKVKGNVKFVEGPRFEEKKVDPEKDAWPATTDMKIDHDKAFDALKGKGPKFTAPKAGMGRAEQRKEEMQKHKEDANEFKVQLKAKSEAEKRAEEKKKVASRETQAARNKPTVARVKKPEKKNIDSQIDQYLQELGLA
ncbi:hypothetical protein FGO68_gene7211 [Halteria grandinella]|uniref:Uncharacterized protein n=1 Tax=Halteria grandinella TaxID=5974 RepID=A0A8J8NZ43_HALGN|nr:hypothetical protein FGO68_gene7211 [Halteria grandinella]